MDHRLTISHDKITENPTLWCETTSCRFEHEMTGDTSVDTAVRIQEEHRKEASE